MKTQKASITPLQFMFSITCFLRSSSLLSSFFAPISKTDSWLVVLIASVVCLPFLWAFIMLMKAFPGKNLIEINDAVFGRIAGKIISAIYLWFFLTLTSLNLRDLGGFVGKSIMLKTPQIVIITVFILLCAWAVSLGLDIVTRYSVVFVILSSIILVVTIAATSNHMRLSNFLPILRQPMKNIIQSTNIVSTIPFGELVIFLMIMPQVNIKPKKLGRYFLPGFFLGAFLITLVVARDIAILGNTITIFAQPSFETLRMVSFFEVLTHMEILFAILLIILFFFKISLLFYVSMLAMSYLFRLDSYKPLILPSAAIIVVYSLIIFKSKTKHLEVGRETAPFMWFIFEFLLPLLTLIIAYIRKLPQKEKDARSKEAASA
ncbi:MAG: endospore germination permease [Oscillospiraceae bacterium]|nr:endospore germination permease [Oscillospiraceae bacterium]